MRKSIVLILCTIVSFAAAGQNTRLVKGIVFNNEDIPAKGATISVVGMSGSTESNENGLFELYVSPYAKNVRVTMEGFLSQTAEIDGSYIVFKLKVDKQYAENKAREAEAARLAAEQAKAAEQARIAAEKEAAERAAAAKAKAEEEARIAAEKEAAAKAKAEERARKAAEKEAAAKAKAEERARIAAEKEAAAKAETSTMTTTKVDTKTESRKAIKAEPKISPLANLGEFRSFVEVNLLNMNDYLLGTLGVSYTGGFYNTDHKLFLGAGVGVNVFDYESHEHQDNSYNYSRNVQEDGFTGKLFVNAKKYFLSGFFKPFVSLSGGIEYALRNRLYGSLHLNNEYFEINQEHFTNGGFSVFAEPQIGVSFGKKIGGYMVVGYKLSSWNPKFYIEEINWEITSGYVLSGLNLSVGVTF